MYLPKTSLPALVTHPLTTYHQGQEEAPKPQENAVVKERGYF